jgi:hypothetical protein
MRGAWLSATIPDTPPVLPESLPRPAAGGTTMIDVHAPSFDVSTSHVVAVDAAPEAVLSSLDRLELTQPVAATIALLGGDRARRVALEPSSLDGATGAERVYGLACRVDGGAAEPVAAADLGAFGAPGYLKVIWDVRVNAAGESGAYVSTTTRFVATDDVARKRLYAAWRVLGPLSADLAKRALASVRRAAERGGDPVAYGSVSGFPAPAATPALMRVA